MMEVIHEERPFQKVGIDLLGPFPATTGGNVNVIVAVDYLTKWAETKALGSATARDADKFFFSKTLRSVTSNVAPVATDLS